ncbi:MAG: 3'-5' exonuclease [Gammaproteobacteria bacterium]|nr:3'-5' exonuclease [Gammaproteobacteria bacterium]MBU1653877.1 3'-5' exonuclease [Gammaproteobacteria bacterium]MBU1962589.1 3'-5' exonuclease [Gammaproteobacteria bacterium]
MRRYLATPFPDPRCDFRQLAYTALDFETTGLDPARDELLSFGIVDMRDMSIALGTAQHEIITPERAIPAQSAIIHGILDDRAAEGIPFDKALELLLERLAGKVLIAHYARIELGFLGTACKRLFGSEFLIPTVDTLLLGHRWIERRKLYLQQTDLRLHSLRTRFALPRYRAHNALTDALSTAELFLALTAQRRSENYVPLKEFLKRV